MRNAPSPRTELHAALAAGYIRVYPWAINWAEQRIAEAQARGADDVTAVAIAAASFLAECESLAGERAPGLLDPAYSYQRASNVARNAATIRPSIDPLRALIEQLDAIAGARTAEAA